MIVSYCTLVTIPFEKKKSLGQNFLTSPVVPGWMCDAAKIAPADVVLEIGPGTGALTRVLLERGAIVIALEADHRAVAVLNETFAAQLQSGQLTVHSADARELDIAKYNLTNHDFKVVANIPYYLTGGLFRTLLESEIQPSTLVFLVQKEVAMRIAKDKKESLLSLSVKAFGEPKYIKTVTKGHFAPPPKIDSAIVAVFNINSDNFTHLPRSFFFSVLHVGFGQKRKQLLGNLANTFDRTSLTHTFSTLNISSNTRAEDLDINTWLELGTALYQLHQTQAIQI